MYSFALGLLLLAWLNPLHIGPWVSWHGEVLAFAAAVVMLMGMLVACKRQQRPIVHIPHSALVWVCFGLVAVLQFMFGLIHFLGDLAILLLYFWLVLVAMGVGFETGLTSSSVNIQAQGDEVARQELVNLAVVVLLGALLSTVVAFVQTLDIWADSEWISRAYSLRRPGGNIAQPNQLASLQLLGIASLAYLFRREKLVGLAALLIFVLLIAGLGLTESRSGVLSAVALAVFWLTYRKRVFGRTSVIYPLAGLLLLLVCFKFLPLASYQLQQGGLTDGTSLTSNISAGTRLAIWPQLLEASMLHPWLGWGLRQVPLAHNAVLHAYQVGEAFTYAHSVVLDLVLGLGYPLAIASMAIFFVWAGRRLIAIRGDLHSWYCMALLIPVAVHSMLEFPFAYAYFLLPVAFSIGVMEARLFPDRAIKIRWLTAVAATTLAVALLAWSVWEYIAIEEDFRVARFEALRIGKTAASYDRPHIVLLTQMDAVLVGIRLVPSPGMSPESIESARKAAVRFPWVATQNRYALTLALNGNPDEARRQLKVMRTMHGEKTYEAIKTSWRELASSKYPQLETFKLP